MSKYHASSHATETPQKAATGGRVIKSSIKQLPQVDAKTWAKIEAAARTHRKGRQYPEIIEVPDGSI